MARRKRCDRGGPSNCSANAHRCVSGKQISLSNPHVLYQLWNSLPRHITDSPTLKYNTGYSVSPEVSARPRVGSPDGRRPEGDPTRGRAGTEGDAEYTLNATCDSSILITGAVFFPCPSLPCRTNAFVPGCPAKQSNSCPRASDLNPDRLSRGFSRPGPAARKPQNQMAALQHGNRRTRWLSGTCSGTRGVLASLRDDSSAAAAALTARDTDAASRSPVEATFRKVKNPEDLYAPFGEPDGKGEEADLKERGLGPLRSERKLQELRRLAMDRTKWRELKKD
ncbi:hypothetical protein Bbelb_167780 [Branchiostoma belcheri]|nr:hypothetical protein Bbelb_167780 [Branchiostoma belcheri]